MRQRMGRWTGATPEEIGLIDRDDQGRLVFPRGTVGVLRAAVAAAGMKLTFEDRRVRHEALDLSLNLTLRDYQEEAANRLGPTHSGHGGPPLRGGQDRYWSGRHRSLRPARVASSSTHTTCLSNGVKHSVPLLVWIQVSSQMGKSPPSELIRSHQSKPSRTLAPPDTLSH